MRLPKIDIQLKRHLEGEQWFYILADDFRGYKDCEIRLYSVSVFVMIPMRGLSRRGWGPGEGPFPEDDKVYKNTP